MAQPGHRQRRKPGRGGLLRYPRIGNATRGAAALRPEMARAAGRPAWRVEGHPGRRVPPGAVAAYCGAALRIQRVRLGRSAAMVEDGLEEFDKAGLKIY